MEKIIISITQPHLAIVIKSMHETSSIRTLIKINPKKKKKA